MLAAPTFDVARPSKQAWRLSLLRMFNIATIPHIVKSTICKDLGTSKKLAAKISKTKKKLFGTPLFRLLKLLLSDIL
jgi:hypothetical protein